MNQGQLQVEKKKYVVLDTCVIQHAGSSNKVKSEKIVECLKELINGGYSLTISEYSIYENLHGLWGKQAQEAAKLLKTFEWKVVSNLVLTVASMLGGLYHNERLDIGDDGDKIIAATTILEQGFVLTENHKDFPSPFFVREKYLPVSFEIGKHHNKTIDLVLYRPDILLINRRVNEKDLN